MNVIGLIWRLALALGWTLLVVGELAASLPSCAPQQFLAVEVQKELSAPFAIKNKSVEFVYDEAPERGLRLRRSVAQEKSTSGRRTAEARFAGVGMGDGFRSLDDFTGKERDAETGLDYFGARYMSAAQGRFTSTDIPLLDQNPGDPQSWNLYNYVRNNPLSNVDPSGRSCVKTQTVNPDGTISDSSADDGDGKGCEAAGVKPDAKGGLSASGNGDSTDRPKRINETLASSSPLSG